MLEPYYTYNIFNIKKSMIKIKKITLCINYY